MPTRSSSAKGGPKRLDRPTAWGCTLTNLITLPGLGSIAAGRRGVGYPQAVIASLGVVGSFVGIGLFIYKWVVTGHLPTGLRPVAIGLIGIALYATAWLWALQTSLSFLREARQTPPPLSNETKPPPPPLPPRL